MVAEKACVVSCILVLLSLTLSGCGGGGSSTTTAPPSGTPAPAPRPTSPAPPPVPSPPPIPAPPAPPAPYPHSTTVKLNNGVEMPILGFAAQVWAPSTCKEATAAALDAGFQNVWSSALIGAECQKSQWEAIKASSVPLDKIFVAGTVNTGSCQSNDECYQVTKTGAQAQLEILAKEPLDMIMLDYPSSSPDCGGILGQWRAFEELYAAKKVRTIAVSNFQVEQLKCITANATLTVPSVNQMSYSVGSGSDPVVADNGAFGIHVQAYSPLGSGGVISDPRVTKIAKAHGKSGAQVALRWILQHNVSIATQSTNPKHLKDDAAIFEFTLTQAEMGQLNAHTSQMILV